MTTMNRNRMTRSTVTRANLVLGMVNGLGARFTGFGAAAPATFRVPGATPSRGYAGIDPSQPRPDCDCQSHRSERTRRSEVAGKRSWQAAKPANPN